MTVNPRHGSITRTSAAIAARIDELPRQDREILQRAAVAGETFELRDAALLAGRDPGEVSGALGRLVHAGYITAVEQGYRFHYPLVHDVAYSRLPLAERMHLHARYAREGADPEDAEALAHHWWRALGEPDAEWVWEDERELAHLRRAAYEAHSRPDVATARASRRNGPLRYSSERSRSAPGLRMWPASNASSGWRMPGTRRVTPPGSTGCLRSRPTGMPA